MSLKMRSIFAQIGSRQVYQKAVSMGSSRNFSSSSTNWEESKIRDYGIYAVTRTIGLTCGFLFGQYTIGDLDKILEEVLEEDMRKAKESLKGREKMLPSYRSK